MWQEEANIIPTDRSINFYLGYDVALSGYTVITSYQRGCDMRLLSGSIKTIVIREGGALEEAHKLTPADGEADNEFVISVDIYGDTDVIAYCADKNMGIHNGSGYV